MWLVAALGSPFKKEPTMDEEFSTVDLTELAGKIKDPGLKAIFELLSSISCVLHILLGDRLGKFNIDTKAKAIKIQQGDRVVEVEPSNLRDLLVEGYIQIPARTMQTLFVLAGKNFSQLRSMVDDIKDNLLTSLELNASRRKEQSEAKGVIDEAVKRNEEFVNRVKEDFAKSFGVTSDIIGKIFGSATDNKDERGKEGPNE